jgi:DMSO/TMAO reductase YedYZ molybdopterin-dependent catalytic subunit
VSSSSWKRAPVAQTQRVWRPIFDDHELAGAPAGEATADDESPAKPSAYASSSDSAAHSRSSDSSGSASKPEGAASIGRQSALSIDELVAIPGVVHYDDLQAEARPERPTRPSHCSGGISFEDDDLEEYMHPDDVPPKRDPS